MNVTLINYTANATELLLLTKNTRLTLGKVLMQEIASWSQDRVYDELAYMAKTIPSSWEFVSYTFLIEGVSRAFTHQFVRTRTGSYAQQSMRVVNMADFRYVLTERNLANPDAMARIDRCLAEIKACYQDLLAMGQPEEDARGVLPTNIATNIIAKFDLRALSGLVQSRTGGRTQDEYQRVAGAMADAVLAVHPWAADFLFPQGRNVFDELEAFAKTKFPNLSERGALLKIIDRLRKGVV